MDASVTQSTGSLYDVLASLPGVVIDSNGNILLNGQSGATILMDGKPTYLSEMNDGESVEIYSCN